jgi:hypothetical protein
MKLIHFDGTPTMRDALASIDALRKDVESGQVVCFIAVGVGSDDACVGYTGSSKPVSRLRLTGAMSNLLHQFNAGSF